MALAVESTFIAAVNAAESVRQFSRASAFATYAFVPANLAAYKTAWAAADVAYLTAVNTARNTSGLTIGNNGDFGPIAGNIGTIAS